MFKITKLVKVKAHENSHNLRTTHRTGTLTVSASIRSLQAHFFDILIIFLAKIINNTENICNFVLGNLHNSYCLILCNYLIYNYKDNKIMRDYQFFKPLFLSRTQVTRTAPSWAMHNLSSLSDGTTPSATRTGA